MGKLPMKLKIMVNYLKSVKSQNYTLTKIFIMSSVKWSDQGHFLKSQGNFFLPFPCTLFLHIFDT